MRGLSTLVAAAIVIGVAGSASDAAAQVRLRYAHVGVANAPQTLYADEVAKTVKERTNGRVEIQVFPNSQLGGVGEMVDGIKSGAIPWATTTSPRSARSCRSSPCSTRRSCIATPSTPWSRPTRARRRRSRTSTSSSSRRAACASSAASFQGARHLTSKEKVLSPKDMQGKKYRGVPIKLWSSMLTGMGAVATPVEVSELATALATGLVIGQENPLPNIYNLKLYEVQKYVMLTGHMQSVLSTFINEKAWQAIPEADRKIIEEVMTEVGRKTLAWDKETAAKYRSDLEGKGMVFVEEKDGLDIAAFRTAVLAQVAKDFPDWTSHIEQIRAVK